MLIHVMDYELAWNINWNEIEIFLGLCCSSDWKFTLFSVETTRLWFNDNVIWPEKGMKWFSRVCVVVNCNECWGKYGVNIDDEISQLIYFLKWIAIFWCNLRFRGAFYLDGKFKFANVSEKKYSNLPLKIFQATSMFLY